MTILSAIVAALTAAMAFTYLTVAGPMPEGGGAAAASIPLYVILAGVVLVPVTWLAGRIYVLLRMYVAGYAVAFSTFAVGFLVFSRRADPDVAAMIASWPSWIQAMEPKPFLALCFVIFATIVVLIARLPIIGETVGMSDSFYGSRDLTTVRGFGGFRFTEGGVGRAFIFAIIVINLVQTYLSILFNNWFGDLFNAFETKDGSGFWIAVRFFFILASIWIVFAISEYLFGQYMLIRWRRHMSKQFVGAWLSDERHYRLQFHGEKADNPDQRISEDIRSYVTSTYSLASSFFSTFLSLAAFIQLLWDLSGRFRAEGEGFFIWLTQVPGFLVWVALAYAVVVTFVGHLIGRPLIRLNFNKERTEADFRYGMARLREYGEQVALIDGAAAEERRLGRLYDTQVEATYALVRTTRNFNVFTFSVSQLSDLLPYILVAPAYFAGAGTLGSLQQTASAFGRVQGGFTVFLNLYESLAAYKAAVNRINGFKDAMAEASLKAGATRPIKLRPVEDDDLEVKGATLGLPDGRMVANVPALRIPPGERTLVTGPSGSGKSTLFRAIAGIWPFGKGEIELPRGKSVMLLPQRPYIPLGTLRGALAYPGATADYTDAAIVEALEAVGLEHLAGRLDQEAIWAQALSGGEQQRVAIVRALLKKPDWLFLDEATAALDEPMEARVYKVLRDRLPQTTIVSIGHRATMFNFHDRRIDFRPNGDGSFTPVDLGAKAAMSSGA
jgi:putative ATP-binding cassette transporter